MVCGVGLGLLRGSDKFPYTVCRAFSAAAVGVGVG